jgi:hypothetical protein
MLITFLEAVSKVARKMLFKSAVEHVNHIVINRIQNPCHSISNVRHHITRDWNTAVKTTREPVQLNTFELTNHGMGLDIYGFVVERDKLELIDIDGPSQLVSSDLTPPPGQIVQPPISPIIALPDSNSELSNTPDDVLEE